MPCISELAASEADRARLREALADLLKNEGCSCNGLPGGPCPRCVVSYRQSSAALSASLPSPEREQLIALLRAGRKYSQMWHQANVGSALDPIRDELFVALRALDGVAS
jgi:hypothetical protein